nr:immunoglobulin heavy chain junction region [Mus musculus]NSM05402.1 immunoglobulin heavy chain junction region [Mus musculus]NSM06947.1 immunoglobulin heavy chain junction region [Mus musculus]
CTPWSYGGYYDYAMDYW